MVFELFRWWYGAGWQQAIKSITVWTASVRRAFSVPVLVNTLFAPWKKIGGQGGNGFDAKMRALVDNFISRFIGFITRFMVLITAGLMTILVVVGGVLYALIWPLLPVIIIYCLFRSITG